MQNSFLHLGVLLYYKLGWAINLELKITKAKRSLFALKQAISKKWGPKPAYMKWAYNSIVKKKIIIRSSCLGCGNEAQDCER